MLLKAPGGGGLGAALEGGGPAEGRCAPAGGAFDGRGGGACEESGVEGGRDDGLAFGGALYSGRFVPAFRQLRLSPRAIASRALQSMGGDLGLAVETPPGIEEALPRPTISTGRRGRWRLL